MKRFGNIADVTNARVALTLFNKADVCSVNIHNVSKILLGQTPFFTKLGDACTECFKELFFTIHTYSLSR